MADPVTQSKSGRKLDLNSELLLGALASNTFFAFLGDYIRSLPRYIDDAERDFGLDIYERMLKDPALSSSIDTLKVAVLSEGLRFVNRVPAPSVAKPDAKQQALFDRGEEIRADVAEMCDRLQQPLEDILEEMLDALSFGHAVAEKTYAQDGGQLRLATLRVKPRSVYAFVVDQFMNFLGLVGAKLGSTSVVPSLSGGVGPGDVIPREKFFVLSYAPAAGDPRGRSMLRPAYNSWYLKQQLWPHYLKFLVQFGTPSIAAYLPPNAGDVEVIDASGNVTLDEDENPVVMTAADAMLQKLIAFANGTAIVLENGSSLDLIQSQGDGAAYVKALDVFDRQMVRAVLLATRATMEAEHGSKADSSTAQDLLSSVVQWIRRKIEIAFCRDVIMPTVRYNWGDEAADTLCPYLSLSDVSREDVVQVGGMIASLAQAELIHTSQLPGIDAKLGLPERDFEAEMEERAEAREAERDQRSMLRGMVAGAGKGDDQEGADDTDTDEAE